MPSSSSSSSSATSSSRRRMRYDVFLSFTGCDTRKTFLSHLYAALKRNGIQTFIDEEGLRKGLAMDKTLIQIIEESRIAVIVLSKNYAGSRWCLIELVKIMECQENNRLIVYPVFYDVNPSDVYHLKGDFGTAFLKHKDEESLKLWRTTLQKVRNLAGWDMNEGSASHEAGCIKEIVKTVDLQLDNILAKNCGNSNDENCEPRDVGILAILGMAGSGKTETARAAFNSMCEQFDGHSFVHNISEVSKSQGLKKALVFLQKQILLDVLGQDVQIKDENDGCWKIKRRLSGMKVLIVLDKVDRVEQLEALVGEPNWFGHGSKIIITTTDERLLKAHKLVYSTQNAILLDDEESIQLLKNCAFQPGIATEGYNECLERVIRYASGNPGALKCLGSKLIGRPINEWEDIIDSLAKCPEAGIDNKLKLCLEGLSTLEFELFLDLACFFNGWIKDDVTDILDSCGLSATSGLTTLKEKSLITFSNGFIQIHNLNIEMGRNIVRQKCPDDPGRQSRLWHPEEIKDVLRENKGTEEVKAIVMSHLNKLDARAAFDAFKSMRKLRLLHINTQRKVFLVHDSTCVSDEWIMEGSGCLKDLPRGLKWLTWDYYNLESWPIDFHAEQLVGLQMRHSSIKDLCINREIKFLDKLQFLDLSFSKDLSKTPDFEWLRNLKKLNLEYCSSLVEVHSSISSHSSLVLLNLRSCEKLESLPPTLKMRSLEILNLSLCSKLTNIPVFEDMMKLLELDMSHNLMEKLPDSIGDLTSLTYLDICNCRNLTSIPPCISVLRNRGVEIIVLGCPVWEDSLVRLQAGQGQ